jgi:predicted Zn-dependent protease
VRCTRKQIAKALDTARRLLKKSPQPAAQVAAALNPYVGCTEIEGVSGRLHEDMRSAIFALMADAYRREEKIELAAKWYRRASQLSPGDHALVYAHMVCKHQLTEFYDDARTIIRDHSRRWKEKSLFTRFVLRLGMWANRETREIARNEKLDHEFLRQNTVAEAA